MSSSPTTCSAAWTKRARTTPRQGPVCWHYAYDNLSRVTSLTFGNGASRSATYNISNTLNWSLSQNMSGTSHDVTATFQ
ncbi:hypothetical protein [Terricaulis silvestris]|uniref:YD repeat (Two copies) n=1 Tax=Terricaulis silvestris TaxID=2686094 RepID=A0A6I6MG66_9CAUL|nr:hypothetical protein [Terricaulis silvestris]QGZ93635.1 hypothetical protein DSM104635_00447 [Terricaulis silvestris]